MSRSKHYTWKDFNKALSKKGTSREERENIFREVNTIGREIDSKRHIKSMTLQLRKAGRSIGADFNLNRKFDRYEKMPHELSFSIEPDCYPNAYLPLSEEDIQTVFSKMPSSFSYRLKKIILTLDKGNEQEEYLPGIWSTNLLGKWGFEKEIFIYGYEIRERSLPFLDEILFYFKVKAMGTLIHEISHHYDFISFYARKGRYKRIKDLDPESYARSVEKELFCTIICPFIKDRYAKECLELERVFERMGVLPLDVEYFEPGLGKADGLIDAIQGYLNGDGKNDLNLYIAEALHEGGETEKSLEYVDYILQSESRDSGSLKLKAHIFFHEMKNTAEAFRIYKKLIAIYPDDPGALMDFAFALYHNGKVARSRRYVKKLLRLGKNKEHKLLKLKMYNWEFRIPAKKKKKKGKMN